ncbi:MAG TPA: acetate--CoA ligase family protein [Euzebyales bacterium]|nr:acetate--CoA ligase family protein [Euzebyales bacterium]
MTAVAQLAAPDAGFRRLRPMLEARSVAVVGASRRPGSVGEQVLRQLLGGGFDGPVHPVNPRYGEVAGLPCVPSMGDISEPVDLAVLAVGNDHLEAQLRLAAELGVGAAVIFASGYERAPGEVPLLARLRETATSADMAVCGGNGMGFVHVERRLWATGYDQPLDLEPGAVTFLSHSGSLFTALLHNRRRVRFNLVVSTGQELVTPMADYLAYAVRQASTRVVALFLETVRDPAGFVAALDAARRRDIAVVALTVGRHSPTRDLVTAHSGALAGDDGAYEAVFDAYGVHRVTTLDELLDTVELFAGQRRASAGGLATLHDSGGERAHLLDLAIDGGVKLAALGARTREPLARTLAPGLPPVNPLDAWGSSRDYEQTFRTCGRLLLDDPDTAGLAFCVDMPDAADQDSYASIARDLAASTDKPVAVLVNVPGALNPVVADEVRRDGIPVLEGTASGLAAFGHLLDHRDHRAGQPPNPEPARNEVVERWRARLELPVAWTEVEALELLEDFGVPTVTRAIVDTEDAAVRAARDIGLPVVLKTADLAIAHKSDVGGVHLNLRDAEQVRASYRDLSARFGPRATVAAMVEPGVELALGVTVDPGFGPLVVVGAGGVLVELLQDRRVALPPLDRGAARRLLDGLAVARLLSGHRGRPPVDVTAVADAVVRLSVLARTLGDRLAALDANPLICGPGGCVAVDALVVPAATAAVRRAGRVDGGDV